VITDLFEEIRDKGGNFTKLRSFGDDRFLIPSVPLFVVTSAVGCWTAPSTFMPRSPEALASNPFVKGRISRGEVGLSTEILAAFEMERLSKSPKIGGEVDTYLVPSSAHSC
jgi:hypothetical protein